MDYIQPVATVKNIPSHILIPDQGGTLRYLIGVKISSARMHVTDCVKKTESEKLPLTFGPTLFDKCKLMVGYAEVVKI